MPSVIPDGRLRGGRPFRRDCLSNNDKPNALVQFWRAIPRRISAIFVFAVGVPIISMVMTSEKLAGTDCGNRRAASADVDGQGREKPATGDFSYWLGVDDRIKLKV